MDTNNEGTLSPDSSSVDQREGAFAFEVQLTTDINAPVPVTAAGARFKYSFRHFRSGIVKIDPRTPHTYNFGIRLYEDGIGKPVFETRAFHDEISLQSQVWAQATAVVPQEDLKNDTPYVLKLDFVKEDEFWFADRLQSDNSYVVHFVRASDEIELIPRLDGIEKQLAQIRHELDVYSSEFNTNMAELATTVEEVRRFRKQIPQILNAVSTANAASSIVGEVRGLLDSEAGVVVKSLSEFRRELSSIWDALDVVSKKCDQEHK